MHVTLHNKISQTNKLFWIHFPHIRQNNQLNDIINAYIWIIAMILFT